MQHSWIARATSNLSIERKITLTVATIVICLVGGQGILGFLSAHGERERMIEQSGRGGEALQADADRAAQSYIELAIALGKIETVRDAFEDRDRDALYAETSEFLRELERAGCEDLRIHYHDTNKHSFLRHWKPDKNGDDISGFRSTVVSAQNERRPIKGIDAGRVGLAVRGVAPVFGSSGQLIGSVEVFQSLPTVAEHLAAASGVPNAVYGFTDVQATAGEENLHLGDFRILQPPDPKFGDDIVTPELLDAAMEGTSQHVVGSTLVTGTPFVDYAGKKTGVFVRFVDLQHVDGRMRGQLARTAIASILGLVIAIFLAVSVVRSSVRPLADVSSVLEAVGEGDLTQRIDTDAKDEIGVMAVALDRALESIRGAMSEFRASAQSLAAAGTELSSISDQMTRGASTASDEASHASTAASRVDEAVQTVAAAAQQIHGSSRDVSDRMSEARKVADEAQRFAMGTNEKMQRLGQSSAEIGDVIKVITSIAEQTNLLALNATIEAARAGEAGKGFAVVASEVKELATQTAKATEDIGGRIETIQADANDAVEAIQSITEIVTRINDISGQVAAELEQQQGATRSIADRSHQAAEATRGISENMQRVASTASESSSAADSVSEASRELAQMGETMNGLVARYRA